MRKILLMLSKIIVMLFCCLLGIAAVIGLGYFFSVKSEIVAGLVFGIVVMLSRILFGKLFFKNNF